MKVRVCRGVGAAYVISIVLCVIYHGWCVWYWNEEDKFRSGLGNSCMLYRCWREMELQGYKVSFVSVHMKENLKCSTVLLMYVKYYALYIQPSTLGS